MASTLIILADGPRAELTTHLGQHAADLYARLLSDTVAVAQKLTDARVVVRYSPRVPAEALASLAPSVELAPTPANSAPTAVLAEALAADRPAILIGDNLPHLPLWRLRDALSYLQSGADLVVGPTDRGGCYLLGMRGADAQLLRTLATGNHTLLSLARMKPGGHVIHILPPWFGVDTVADLASLAEDLRTMPPYVAPHTRGLIEASQASRAVGG